MNFVIYLVRPNRKFCNFTGVYNNNALVVSVMHQNVASVHCH